MYCVIAGDVIQSRKLTPALRAQAARQIEALWVRLNADYAAQLLADFGAVRGDAFEGVLHSPQAAVQIVREIVEAFDEMERATPGLRLRARICCAVGALSVVSRERNETDGPAFHAAEQKMNEMKAQKSTHWLQVAFAADTPTQPLLDGISALLSALTARWTRRQREAVCWMQRLNNQKEVSAAMGITPTAVSAHLKAADFRAYRRAWASLEEYFAKGGGENVD